MSEEDARVSNLTDIKWHLINIDKALTIIIVVLFAQIGITVSLFLYLRLIS